MNKIDISNWGEFKVGDLFNIELAKGDIQAKLSNEGNIPLVSSGMTNNGICKYISETNQSELFPSNSITVDMFGKAFYQNTQFYAVGHGRVNILIPKEKIKMTENIGKFICSIIEKTTSQKYQFNNMCSSKALIYHKIKLPIDKNGEPDWNYMESYMKHIEKLSQEKLSRLIQILRGGGHRFEINQWKEFKIKELFEVKRPIARSVSDYEDGNVPFIASGNYNNGIIKFCKPKNNETLDKGNCITVSPIDASSFYQDKDFLGRGGAGSAIILLYNKNLNLNSGLFISSIIRNKFTKYSYNYQLSSSSITEETIKLPSTVNGEPDWNYMNEYISYIQTKAILILNSVNKVCVKQ